MNFRKMLAGSGLWIPVTARRLFAKIEMPDKVVALLLGAICGACSALAVFPIYEKVLGILKPIRERNERFSYYSIGFI
jgi:hypothetical protein